MRGVVVKVGRGRTTGREMGAASQNAVGTEMRTRAKRRRKEEKEMGRRNDEKEKKELGLGVEEQ